jgi:hypothetical protein
MADLTEHDIVLPDSEMDKDAPRACMALLHAGAAMLKTSGQSGLRYQISRGYVIVAT